MRLSLRDIALMALCMLTMIVSCGNTELDDFENKPVGRITYCSPLVIAHRGYHHDKNTPPNSYAAYMEALSLNILGTECDVRQTKDGVFVINHDETINGINIGNSYYSQLAGLQLSNGEPLPRLETFLSALKMSNTRVKLVLDLKYCNIDQLVNLIEEYNIIDRVLFISFSQSYCNQLGKKGLGEHTYYLNGDLSPEKVKKAGYAGIDYKEDVYTKHETWIKDAQALGLQTIVWTVNDKDRINQFIQRGVIVTTDKPLYAQGVKHIGL